MKNGSDNVRFRTLAPAFPGAVGNRARARSEFLLFELLFWRGTNNNRDRSFMAFAENFGDGLRPAEENVVSDRKNVAKWRNRSANDRRLKRLSD